MYTNAQSLIAPKNEIQHQIMKNVNLAILALSKTRLIAEIKDSEINVPGYNVDRCDEESRNAGSVALYTKDDINYEIVKKIDRN